MYWKKVWVNQTVALSAVSDIAIGLQHRTGIFSSSFCQENVARWEKLITSLLFGLNKLDGAQRAPKFSCKIWKFKWFTDILTKISSTIF